MACDIPEPFKFPSLDSCQKRFLQTPKEVDLAPHPVVGLLLQVENTEKFPHALGFENLDFRMMLSRHRAKMTPRITQRSCHAEKIPIYAENTLGASVLKNTVE